ncbi:MAG: large subunit ribosomal protein L24e [archaeon GW2011_AR10]|uniref:Large ribosomal subunit protein eL24 n=2 Tax=Candidatus Iainarchaeum sp. TaxID=3101447 RepID=A0A7J4IZH0_9ARCH|nr:MAG: large subunit ribosomal protein L24e [archaeon GW2011_AR10]HIH08366.1 50S ribosomal protein L24e [Candidatus Diapherotrites archaeon]
MAKCSFCGKDIPKGTGKMFVRKDGSYENFCSNKCDKNMVKLNRNPQKTKWTEAHYRAKEARKGK